jgi:hypothetical protein
MVVVMTDENSNKLVTDANATRTGANQPSRTGKEPRSQADG